MESNTDYLYLEALIWVECDVNAGPARASRWRVARRMRANTLESEVLYK